MKRGLNEAIWSYFQPEDIEQQEPDGRRFTQFGHNILTLSQSVALLCHNSVCKHFANGVEKDRNKKSW